VCEKREHVNGTYRKEVKPSERRRREALKMIWLSRSQVETIAAGRKSGVITRIQPTPKKFRVDRGGLGCRPPINVKY
jgi:hypothetical protein